MYRVKRKYGRARARSFGGYRKRRSSRGRKVYKVVYYR